MVRPATVCTHPHTAPIGGRDNPERRGQLTRLSTYFTICANLRTAWYKVTTSWCSTLSWLFSPFT